MTPRPHARTRRAALLLAFAGLIALAGCDPRALLYFLQPEDPMIPPPKNSPDLKGKRVVVLTHAAVGSADFVSLDHVLNREFSNILSQNVKEIDLVDPDKVWDWVEGHPNWTDPGDAAKDFEADIAIFLEVEDCALSQPGDLNVIHGTAKTHIQAFELRYRKNSKGKPIKDQPKEAHSVYDDYQDTEFPKTAPLALDSGVSRGAFKNRFIQILAADCSWHFVPHAVDDIQDTKGLMK